MPTAVELLYLHQVCVDPFGECLLLCCVMFICMCFKSARHNIPITHAHMRAHTHTHTTHTHTRTHACTHISTKLPLGCITYVTPKNMIVKKMSLVWHQRLVDWLFLSLDKLNERSSTSVHFRSVSDEVKESFRDILLNWFFPYDSLSNFCTAFKARDAVNRTSCI